MLDILVLIPILVLALGAIISTAAPRFSEPTQRWLVTGILTLSLLAVLLNAAPTSHQLDISNWDAAKFLITLRLDGIALVTVAAIFISLIALSLIASRATGDSFTFYVLLSCTLLITAGNLLTTVFAWAFLDLALYAWRTARRIPHDAAIRALILGLLAGLALFAGIILLDLKQTQTGAFLIALAFCARLGLFPFHWIFPPQDLQTLELVGVRGAALAAGASLWLRWSELGIPVPSELIAWLASITFIFAIVLIATRTEAMDKLAPNATLAIAYVPLAVAFGDAAGGALALSLTLSVLFALALFELGLVWQSNAQNRWARLSFVAGILSIAGTPLTPAFLGRVGGFIALIEYGQWLLFLLGALATMIALVSLWRLSGKLRGTELRESTRLEYAGLYILGFTFIAYGFGAGLIALVTGDAGERALDLVILTDDYLGIALAFSALIASLFISFAFARMNEIHHATIQDIAQFAMRVFELDWLARALTRLGNGISGLAQGLTALAEENPTVWILFAALWIAIFILTTR